MDEINQIWVYIFLIFFGLLVLGAILLSLQNKSLKNEIKENRKEILTFIQAQFTDSGMKQEQKIENLRTVMDLRVTEIRDTVDEKLQKTLEDKIGQSFKLVSDRLEQVYKGLGEMQNLASGVGDLKRVLSNVKTRGILGELQLKAILEQILSPEQYEENVATKPQSKERVEFAVKLPGDEEGPVYLPIDAKFPQEPYARLLEAYEDGQGDEIEEAYKVLERSIKNSAKEISEKYIEPPYTTDFAILFLPVEGLYAEVVRRGLTEVLQREYKINIAGPTTMAALLNSLHMGFKTLAIQRRSSEVWSVLGAVKTEFGKFGSVLTQAQNRINQANTELDRLIGVRTRSIERRLNNIAKLDEDSSDEILELDNFDDKDLLEEEGKRGIEDTEDIEDTKDTEDI